MTEETQIYERSCTVSWSLL